MNELGLFPLGIVLLPTERLPLHIFEERYQELVEECLEQDAEFGLVFADGDGIHDVGTRARVAEVLTRFEDGRLNILIEGGERFQVEELTDGGRSTPAQVSPIDDADDAADAAAIEEAMRIFGVLRDVTGSESRRPIRRRPSSRSRSRARWSCPPARSWCSSRDFRSGGGSSSSTSCSSTPCSLPRSAGRPSARRDGRVDLGDTSGRVDFGVRCARALVRGRIRCSSWP